MDMVTIEFDRRNMRRDLSDIRDQLCEIAEQEATRLYRLAWRMIAHGCDPKNVEKCRDEARELHMCAYPERLLDPFRVWNYAFKI